MITRDDICDLLGIPFSAQQLDAICAPLEPGVIIAGAGSGKTTVMAARVVYLVASRMVLPEEVLGLTFTRKAAGELAQRVRDALDRAGLIDHDGVDEVGEQVVMTYDAFAASIVAEHGLRLGVEREPTMITDTTRFRLAAQVVRKASSRFEHLSRLSPRTIAQRVLGLDQQLTSHLLSTSVLEPHAHEHLQAWAQAPLRRGGKPYTAVEDARATLEERLELAALVEDYQEVKRRVGVVEFADQMAVAARLAHEVPEVARAARAAHAVVLLDEYQDTSSAQGQLLRGLFSGPDPRSGRGHPVTAVGDPYQAIYGWRGAAASNIVNFAEEFPQRSGASAASYALTVNRRSGQNILDVANDVAACLHEEQRRLEMTPNFLEAPEAVPAGEVRAASFSTWPEEVTWIVDDIIARHTPGAIAWSDMAVLTRRNADLATIYTQLSERDVPAEIVGLGGLLELPEIQDVVSTLRLVDDVTANPDLVRLLTGPRWRIGPRDLALLGARARDLAKEHPGDPDESDPLAAALDDAVADVDPSEMVSLLDAMADPGPGPYSDQARERFALLSGELATLRAHSGEPVLDLVRRVIATIGVDIEVAATPAFDRTQRRTQLAVFLDAVADHVDVDPDASLSGLLAWMQDEVEEAQGLERATPSEQDSVKLLTVHKAKGLEWEHVYLPALVEKVFPADRVTDNWVTTAAVAPADLRGDAAAIAQLPDATNAAIAEYKKDLKKELLRSEDRLAYVAVTRARQHLTATTHYWRVETTKARIPSVYFRAVETRARAHGWLGPMADPPADGAVHPLIEAGVRVEWPTVLDPEELRRRHEAADRVQAARERYERTGGHESGDAEPLSVDAASLVAQWDADAERLLSEARESRRGGRGVVVPRTMSVTDLLRAHSDPDQYVESLARPMPRPPAPRARVGTRFHQWVEQHYATLGLATPPLVDLDDVPDRGDDVTADEQELEELARRFAAGRYGQRRPVALEAPFTLMVDGQFVRGRIDAVFASDGEERVDYQVVDWKTGAHEYTDPGQLALYRRAWATIAGVDIERVDAVFHYVTSDRTVRPELPSIDDLTAPLRAWS